MRSEVILEAKIKDIKLTYCYTYGLCLEATTGFTNEITNTNFNEILSNGHTARGILVYFFCNWLNVHAVTRRNWLKDHKKELHNFLLQEEQEWTVKIDNTGALILHNRQKQQEKQLEYLFHAVNLGLNDKEIREERRKQEKIQEKIQEEIKKYRDLKIHNHFCAVLDQFETSKKVNFYEVNI